MKIKIFEFNPIQENTYLLYDEESLDAVIIDCGAYHNEEKIQLKDFIESNNLNLKYLLNTHLHFDHVLGNHFIHKAYNMKPMYNKEEESMPGLRQQTQAVRFPIDYEPVFADTYINDGDEIVFGNCKLKALLTPGHSPGSLSFYSEKDNCVFTGDALFFHSIGRTDLWGGDYDTLVNAINTKLLTLPAETVVYPGHGPSSTIKEEKQYNPYLK